MIGRFTQEGTYRGDGLNLYSYVRNNPVNFVDPRGHMSYPVHAELDGSEGSYSSGSRISGSNAKAECGSNVFDYTSNNNQGRIFDDGSVEMGILGWDTGGMAEEAFEGVAETVKSSVRIDKWGPELVKMMAEDYSINPLKQQMNMLKRNKAILENMYTDFNDQVIKGDKYTRSRYGGTILADILMGELGKSLSGFKSGKWVDEAVDTIDEVTDVVDEVSGVIDEGVEYDSKKKSKSLRDGAERAAGYSKNWSNGSLNETIEKFAPDSKPIITDKGKMIYTNTETGIQVVYDSKGNYFRIEDTSRPRGRNYLDLDGNDMNNKVVNGKQMGRNKKEYQMVTHFNNID